ncbi:hypothetical protein [Cellulomonas dongxiuzhuiae]|uniref:Uncharacterized protein n=1 Tax=Cellulomonas dongxiuzhuiae TaxID=2819979 RepID=A0ABX8GIH9_9CELL|nr:hypothetical protein [Cellulomonas dongxiuzhuiae]MBO3094996.1 hypothetical protein [Cellulomonas dongxiuzhuiae]QWC16013.1 hypothetical protein KKR89_17515 [Cellulomonas dongxiuzhuiae]
MIISVGSRRAAVVGDESTAAFATEGVVRETTSSHAASTSDAPARCVVEILRRGGGLMPRALVGGAFTPHEGEDLVIEVRTSGTEPAGAPTCASTLWSPLVPGLPEEFVRPSVAGVLKGGLPAGRFTLDRAAFDPVESSPMAFELAGELLAVVLGAMSGGRDVEESARSTIGAWP